MGLCVCDFTSPCDSVCDFTSIWDSVYDFVSPLQESGVFGGLAVASLNRTAVMRIGSQSQLLLDVPMSANGIQNEARAFLQCANNYMNSCIISINVLCIISTNVIEPSINYYK